MRIVRAAKKGTMGGVDEFVDESKEILFEDEVEGGEGFVEKEKLGLLHERDAEGDALALTSRELGRFAFGQRSEVEFV